MKCGFNSKSHWWKNRNDLMESREDFWHVANQSLTEAPVENKPIVWCWSSKPSRSEELFGEELDLTFFSGLCVFWKSNRTCERRQSAGAPLWFPPEEVLYCNRQHFNPVPLRVARQAQVGAARFRGSASQRPLLRPGFGRGEAVADAGAGGGDAAEGGLVGLRGALRAAFWRRVSEGGQ